METIIIWIITYSICKTNLSYRIFSFNYLIQMLCLIAQPLLLIFLMGFFEPCSTISTGYAWFLAICAILTSICLSLIIHCVSKSIFSLNNRIEFILFQYFQCIQMLGLQMRVAYHGLIYRKVRKIYENKKKLDLIDIYVGPTFIKSFIIYLQFR